MRAAQSSTKEVDKGGYFLLIGILSSFALCGGIIFFFKGIIIGGSGMKGILLGTLGGGIGILILSAAGEALSERLFSTARAKRGLDLVKYLLLLALISSFVYYLLIPTFRRSPTEYGYARDAQYEITYSSGKRETKTGAELSLEKWEYQAGLYLALTLVATAVWLVGLSMRVGVWVRAKTLPVERPR